MKQNAGGLVSAVLSLAEQTGLQPGQPMPKIHWIGHADPAMQRMDARLLENDAFVAHPVFLDEAVNKGFYEGFSNDSLWPLFHYFTSYASFRADDFAHYQQANDEFLKVLLSMTEPGDLVWIHDFQLMLLPCLLRQARPDAAIGYFHHIPFPTHEIVKLLPRHWRKALLSGVLGADVAGFHTAEYAQHFRQSVTETLALPVLHDRVVLPDRSVTVGTFPISIDYHKFDQGAQTAEVVNVREQYQSLLRHNKLIFSVDRLDYTKGILFRLQGYERFLTQHPDWHNRVTFAMTVVPSRDKITQYQELKREIEETVGRINGSFGTIGWRPIVYSYTSLTFTELLALYSGCDVALITPIRDGMNLVCKEFVASRSDERGVLVLSELAGAAQELPDALIINPTDTQEVADAIWQGLTMPAEQQTARMRAMRHQVQNHNVFRWSHDFLQAMTNHANPLMPIETNLPVDSFVDAFAEARRRLLLLDFDGTLAPIVNNPAEARLSVGLARTLHDLAECVDLVVISGRDRLFLEKTFAELPVTLVAEHGAFLKQPAEAWQQLDLTNHDWTTSVRAILETYVAGWAGSVLEEKETSLAWHYRMVEADDIESRAVELANRLRNLTSETPLTVIQGSKVVEVKPAQHSKGTVARAIVEQTTYDFVLSIGDDATDEDMFQLLPVWAYTLKVGAGTSSARHRLARQTDVEALLARLVQVSLPVG